jgi:hypothetical protein
VTRPAAEIRDDIATCDRVRPHLRDLGDVAALDARRAGYVRELADAEPTLAAVA